MAKDQIAKDKIAKGKIAKYQIAEGTIAKDETQRKPQPRHAVAASAVADFGPHISSLVCMCL